MKINDHEKQTELMALNTVSIIQYVLNSVLVIIDEILSKGTKLVLLQQAEEQAIIL